jgi:hypothetical protein
MKTRVPTWAVPDSTFRLIERLSSLPIKLHQIDQKDYISELFREAITICRNHSVKKEVVSAIFQLLTGTVLNMNSRRHLLTLPSFVADIITSFECFRKASYPVAAFFLVAAQDRDNRLMIVETDGFIYVISSLLKDESTTVRKVAIALVKVIAVDVAGRTALLTVGCSKLFNSLFECAKKVVLEEDCLESIRCLISSDTAKTLCEEERLLERILPDNTTQHDIIAAKIIYRMSSFLYVNGKGMSRLVDVILQLSASSCPKVRYWGVKALAKQTKIEACSFFLIHTPTVANIVAKTLANLVVEEDIDVHEIAMSMIVDLSSNPLNHRPLTKNTALLTSLAAEVGQKSSKAAVLTFLNLASSEKMRGVLAKTYNLAASLSKFGLTSSNEDNDELKKRALQCVIWLVPLM